MEYYTVEMSLDPRTIEVDDLPDRFPTYYKLRKAEPISAEWPRELVLNISQQSGDMLTDFIKNPDRQLYLSRRARDAFARLGWREEEGEFLPFALKDKKGRRRDEPYFVLNLLTSPACMDRERSVFKTYPTAPDKIAVINRLHLRADQIPDKARLFRLGEDRRFIVMRSDLLEALKQEGLVGLRLLPLGEDVS